MKGDLVPTTDYTVIDPEDDAEIGRLWEKLAATYRPTAEYLAVAAKLDAVLRSPEHRARCRELGLRTAED